MAPALRDPSGVYGRSASSPPTKSQAVGPFSGLCSLVFLFHPYTAKRIDDIAAIRSMHTEAIHHELGITFIQTGRPCS